jgi:CheY-like chemotaxis protein
VNPEREVERGRELPASAVPISEALRDVRLARGGVGPSPAGHVSAAVAAALRAAVDWLTADGFDTRPPRITSHYGALELRFDAVAHSGLEAAAEVLESADSNLGPAEAGSGWILRVPLLAERETYLLIEQGHLALAVPWHAVVRVRLLPAETIDATARRHSYAVLEPYARAVPEHDERLAVLIALGLRRGLLVADRLIWRVPAERITPTDPPPAPGLTRLVRTEEGQGYWVVDPRQALHGVGPMQLPAPTEPPRREPPVHEEPKAPEPERPRILVLRPEDIEPFGEEEIETAPTEGAPETEEPSPTDASASETTSTIESIESEIAGILEMAIERAQSEPEPTPEPTPELEPMLEAEPAPIELESEAAPMSDLEPMTLSPDSVEPIDEPRMAAAVETPAAPEPSAAEAPAASAAAAPETPATEPVAAAAPARTALVAEDSITARYFLTRLLEQRGFAVRAVSTAAEMRHAAREPFGFVFADVELPDQRGAAYLAPLVERLSAVGTSVVALVRDVADTEAARVAGVTHMLRKPFDSDALDRLLHRLGLVERTR